MAALPATFTGLAFGTAKDAATRVGPNFYDTDGLVMNFDWWWAGGLLVVPIFFIAHLYPRLTVPAFLIAAVPQCASAHIFFIRFVKTGWGDGMEGLAYIFAGAMTLMFAGAAAVGYISGRLRRRWVQTQAYPGI